MTDIGCQFFVLDDSTPDAIRQVADAGFDGVEFAFDVEDADLAAVEAAIDETGVAIAGAHVSREQLEDAFDDTVAFYDGLGCDRIVVPYLHHPYFEDADAIEEAATLLNGFADRLADRGLSLCYHNHNHEFHDVGGRTALEALVESLDDGVGIELDVRHVARAGRDPLELTRCLGDRVHILHVGDVDEADEPTALGTGITPVAKCITTAATQGTPWIVHENDPAVQTLEEANAFIADALE